MITPKASPDIPADLRRRAQARLKSRTAGLEKISPEEARNLLQELQIHQVELEMRNEEIRRTQAELETALARYTDLYDFAPVAYLTLDDRGWVLEAIILSFGVAAFPEHGDNPDAVLNAADAAMYRAKQQGRDRVVAAGWDRVPLHGAG